MEKSALTEEIRINLKQGTKVQFKWYGNKDATYTGRIEVGKNQGILYFINEHNFENDVLVNEGMRYYNSLDGFFNFTEFKII